MLDFVEAEGIETVSFLDILPNPTVDIVNAATKVYKESGATSIVALGGGSPMDVAKAVGVLARYGGSITEYEGAHLVPGPIEPIIAIPNQKGNRCRYDCSNGGNEDNLVIDILHDLIGFGPDGSGKNRLCVSAEDCDSQKCSGILAVTVSFGGFCFITGMGVFMLGISILCAVFGVYFAKWMGRLFVWCTRKVTKKGGSRS